MIIQDSIYQVVEIAEPVLIELLNSPAILRLKKISQFGIPDKYNSRKGYFRYEHSVGVMLLLRRLGAGIDEQIAGLLHDVSVLAFSHVADWVFSDGRNGVEGYHDSIHKNFLQNTEIPEILKKYGFDLDKITDENNFSMLEKEMPFLCADRIDYALREFKYWLNPSIVDDCIECLINHNGEIVFNNQETALDFANHFLELQTQNWGSYQAVMRYHLFSKALKSAIDNSFLKQDDFFSDELYILNKLEQSNNQEIKELLEVLKDKNLSNIKNKTGEKVIKKFRYVDPNILHQNKLVQLSFLSQEFKSNLKRHYDINQEGLIV